MRKIRVADTETSGLSPEEGQDCWRLHGLTYKRLKRAGT